MGKPLDECSREELVEIIKSQKETISRTKKFGLVWEDKPEKVATDCANKLPVIKEVTDKVILKDDYSKPTNIIIEGDNYHALSVLNYTHAKKVDVIYIDPPYNTGARDWKYNNNYVDEKDDYRHSKWLAMMEKRLLLAKNLLNPDHSALICTIDEKEFLHLGCLLEQIFPDANIQMVDLVINLSGTGRTNEFTRTNEFAFFVTFGTAKILPITDNSVKDKKITWAHLHRSELSNIRAKTKAQFYPIFVNDKTRTIEKVGEPLPLDVDRNTVQAPEGCTAVFPVRDDEVETMWGCTAEELKNRIKKGYVRVGKYQPNLPQKYAIGYLKSGVINDIESGVARVTGYDDRGAVMAVYNSGKKKMPTTVMANPMYDANRYGTKFVTTLVGPGSFTYPKSLYATKDCLQFVIGDKSDAIILDYFAGSGTTLHAVNLLNAEDDGSRQCIIVTNNEVSEEEAKQLTKKGLKPGDEEWEKHGIAQAVTWPRTHNSIHGIDVNGNELEGSYQGSGIPMSNGLKSNVRYFKTEFIDKNDTMDKLRRELSPACEDMIRVREDAFEKVIDDDMLKVFKNARGLTAIIYDRFELAEYIQKIEALDTDAPVHLYVFSYSKSNRKDEMPDNLKHKYEAQPIPEGVLEIYKKIFANIKGGKNA